MTSPITTTTNATKPMSALIGHRGLPSQAPENTAASLKAAFEQGIDWIEVDVTMAGDGSLVILHDADLRRFGSRIGPWRHSTGQPYSRSMPAAGSTPNSRASPFSL